MASDAARSDLLQGTLDVLILKIVALGPIHGYAIAQRLQQMSADVLRVQQGSLYPALHRLEKRSWLRAEWRSQGRQDPAPAAQSGGHPSSAAATARTAINSADAGGIAEAAAAGSGSAGHFAAAT